MEERWDSRTTLLLGQDKMERLRAAHVLVVGTGGVGAYAAELLGRAGVGALTLVDADCVALTNLNRQLPALRSTIGKPKAEWLAARLHDINPSAKIGAIPRYLAITDIAPLLDELLPDFIVDAIDTVAPKCQLIYEAHERRIPIISSMGAGAKSDLTRIAYADLWSTYNCGLSRAVRKRLKLMGDRRKHPVVFSSETADSNAVVAVEGERDKRFTVGTVSYIPAAFGCYLAQYVIQHL